MEEVKLVELSVLASGEQSQGIDSSVITEIKHQEETVFGGELRLRAQAAIRNATGGRIDLDADKFNTFTAKKLAIELLKTAKKRTIEIPPACNPSKRPSKISQSELDKVISDCVDAFQTLVSGRGGNLDQGAQQQVSQLKASIQQEIDLLSAKIASAEAGLLDIENLLGASNDLTETIIKWTIPSLGILLVLILIGPKVYSDNIQQDIFSNKLILDLLTVYILVSTILILGLANRIQNEVLGTLLGGISGYVLGRSLGGSQNSRASSSAAGAQPSVKPMDDLI